MERSGGKILINIIILLGILLFIIVYILFIYFLRKKGYQPTFLTDESSSQGTVTCDPIKSLNKCENLGDPCIQCKDGLYSCQEVPEEGITIKYEDGNTYTIPKGKYCLPAKVDTSTKCNPYTSDPVLSKVSDSLYKWRCYCKYPQWFASAGLDKDCNVPLMCNVQDNSNNKLYHCKTGGYVSNDLGEITCLDGSTPIEYSNNDKTDPKNIFCKCAPGSYFYDNKELQLKECIDSPCGNDGTPVYNPDGTLDCKCPINSFSCNRLPDDKKSECSVGCIRDTCIPENVAEKCKNGGDPSFCKTEYNGKDGCDCGSEYTFIKDKNLPTNGYCFPINSTCTNDLNNNCNMRGGDCIMCPHKDQSGSSQDTIKSWCVNCKASKGFISTKSFDPKNFCNLPDTAKSSECTECVNVFDSCKTDGECCTGRCHSDNTCQPCNGYDGWTPDLTKDICKSGYNFIMPPTVPEEMMGCYGPNGDYYKPDLSDFNKSNRKAWNNYCKKLNNGSRPFCNVYNRRGDWDSKDPLYIGFCESIDYANDNQTQKKDSTMVPGNELDNNGGNYTYNCE